MIGRQHHNTQSAASKDPYKIWRPQERQVESDSERPRYKSTNTSHSQKNQEDGRYHSSNHGYKSDSPVTTSAFQYRSGGSSSRTLHHPSRPSVSSNNVSRSQQPLASSSATSTPTAPLHPYRSQPQRSQPEAHGSRAHPKNRNVSTPTPQSSYERVPSADEFAKTSRSNPLSRSGHAAAVPQPTLTPEVWMPSIQDPLSQSRRLKDKDRDKDRDRDKERAKDRDKDKVRDNSDRRREWEAERRDDTYPDPYRGTYRDRTRERDKYQDGRVEEGREAASHRSYPKTPSTNDTKTREPTITTTSGHRRHRSEEVPPSSATAWRPHTDSKQPSTTVLAQQSTSTSQPTALGGQVNVPPPTPRVMPVYLPAKYSKPSHERSSSTPAILASRGISTSDSEQTSRREHQSRSANDPSLVTGTSRPPETDQEDREPQLAPLKSKLGASYQVVRSKFSGTQPSAALPKPEDLNFSQVPSTHPASSLSVLPTENRRHASAKPQFVSIRAGQGPSDPQTSDALFKKSAKLRENRPDVSEQPSASPQLSNSRVQEHVKRYEASIRAEVPPSTSTRAHTNVVEQNSRPGLTPKPFSHQSANAAMSHDRSQTHEASTRTEVIVSTSSRMRVSSVEPNDRSGLSSQPPMHQSTHTSHDRTQSYEVCSDQAAPTSHAHTSVEPLNRSEATIKPSTYQTVSVSNGIPQSDETRIRLDVVVPTPLRARTTNMEANHRSASTAKPSLSQPDAAPLNRLPKSRTVRFDLPDPSPTLPAVVASTVAVQTTSSTLSSSRSVPVTANDVRSPPMLVPIVSSSSSSSRQTSTPSSRSNQILSPSPQITAMNALPLPTVIDQQPLAPSVARSLVSLSQPQPIGNETSSSLSTAPQTSLAKSTPLQTEHNRMEKSERSAERTLTVPAPVLPAVTLQTPWMLTPVQTTPSQSTTRSTKPSDAPSARLHDMYATPAERNFRQGCAKLDMAPHQNQMPVPVPRTSSTADQLRTISPSSRPPIATIDSQFSLAATKQSMTVPVVTSSQTMSSQSLVANASDTQLAKNEFIIQSQAAAEDVIELPALPPKRTDSHIFGTSKYEQVAHQPLSSAPDNAYPLLEQRIASISTNGRDATTNGPDIHFSPASGVQAHMQSKIMPVLSGGGHSRQNSIDVSTSPEISIYAPVPQISVEDSFNQVQRRDVFPPVVAEAKSLPADSNLSTDTPAATPQTAPTPQTTLSRDMFDSQKMTELRSPRLFNAIPLTPSSFSRSATSTSASSNQPTIGSDSSKPRKTLLNDDLPLTYAEFHKEQDASATRDADDTVVLRGQLDEHSQIPAKVGPPFSSSIGVDHSRSSHDPAVENTSRTMPSRSWYQGVKQPEKPSPCPQLTVDLPPSTTASAIKDESHAVPNQQPILSKTIPHRTHAGDIGHKPIDFNQHGILPKAAPSTARHVSYNASPNELRSPKPVNHATLFKGGMHSRDNTDEHNDVRRGEDTTPAPPTVLEKQRTEVYRSASRATTSVVPSTLDAPSRFPVLEDVMQRSSTISKLERQKFTYVPASVPAPDPHHDLLSPVQQVIRAPPATQISSRSLSYDVQTSNQHSREQTDASSTASSQDPASRSQPYSIATMPAPITSSTATSRPSAPITQGTSPNPYYPSRPDESMTTSRTSPSSVYPSASAYPTALNRSETQLKTPLISQEADPQKIYLASASQQTSHHRPSASYSQPLRPPDIPQPNAISRASDGAQRAPVNRFQVYPEPHPSASNPSIVTQEPIGNHYHNVSLSKVTSQPTPVPKSHLPATQKPSSSSINPTQPPPPLTPAGSLYHPRPELSQQATTSTRAPASGLLTTPAPSRSRPSRQPSRMASDESILMTPSSLAPSMPPITRQESKQSKDAHKKKNGFLGNLFRSKSPIQKSYEIWHPSTSDKQRNQSHSSLQSTGKASVLPSGPSTKNSSASATQIRAPAPVAVDLPLKAAGHKEPDQKVFSAFKFLHTKRDRTVSHASVEAQDGLTQTATNTVLGSPTQSSRSQTPFAPPPIRDPLVATQEWRNREEAEMRSSAKERRQRPGIVFDMEEDPPEPVPRKKLSRRRH